MLLQGALVKKCATDLISELVVREIWQFRTCCSVRPCAIYWFSCNCWRLSHEYRTAWHLLKFAPKATNYLPGFCFLIASEWCWLVMVLPTALEMIFAQLLILTLSEQDHLRRLSLLVLGITLCCMSCGNVQDSTDRNCCVDLVYW